MGRDCLSHNTRALAVYLAEKQGPPSFYPTNDTVIFRTTTRTCLQCGQPYTISIPYELCNPGIRDLCDDCLLQPTTTTTTKKLSGSGSGTGSVGNFGGV